MILYNLNNVNINKSKIDKDDGNRKIVIKRHRSWCLLPIILHSDILLIYNTYPSTFNSPTSL